jgi:hypothetical protein
MDFNPKTKRLRYIGHVLNLIIEAYLFRQDVKEFKKKYKEQGLIGRRKI